MVLNQVSGAKSDADGELVIEGGEMNVLRMALLLVTLACVGITDGYAETPLFNKHLVKLLGTWKSDHEVVIFKADRTIVYKGKRYIGAVAQGTIQIKKRKSVVMLPYRFQSGKLIITDHDKVTAYTRVD